jgi:D-psicose/D-tagatose/L-ribulose 3-epimerase
MKYGMNLLLWTGDLDDSLLPVLEKLKKLGYDGVEVPLFNLDVQKCAAWNKKLDDLGLERACVTVRNAPDNPISPDAKIRATGVAKNKLTLDCCQAIGAKALIGPYHSAIGVFSGAGPTPDEWRWGVDSMRQVAEHADKVKVTLGVEYLNRFETYLLTSAADAVRFVQAVDHPRCLTMYDTFHANIEEKNVAAAIRAIAPYMAQVHVSENDRGTPGQGGIPWKTTFDTLKEVGFDGWLTVEAFGLALPEIAAATKIWRRMYESEEQLARDAMTFMRREVAARWK